LDNNYLLSDAYDASDTGIPSPDENINKEKVKKIKMNRLNQYQMHQLHQITNSKDGKNTLQFRSWIDILHIRKDYETRLEIPGKYVARYYFNCYDITATGQGSKEDDHQSFEQLLIFLLFISIIYFILFYY
jgi:hypothetical protein